MDDHGASAFGEEGRDLNGAGGAQGAAGSPNNGSGGGQGTAGASTDGSPDSGAGGTKAPKVKNAPKDVKVEVKTEGCTDMSSSQCSSARTACMTAGGGSGGFKPPTITYVRVDGGDWTQSGLSCGPPTTVNLPETVGGGATTVQVEAPPVPTLGQIQSAFRSLPFSKPSATVQPKGQRTAKNFTTYYAAEWPDDKGLQPGEVSKKVKLLSWSIEFKVAAKDYRYNYGDGSSSGWTTSSGGTYPNGDITHKYSKTGDVEVNVDARLTGKYRVNGGDWQDIGTVADLQDEPSFTLGVRGTKTRLTDSAGTN